MSGHEEFGGLPPPPASKRAHDHSGAARAELEIEHGHDLLARSEAIDRDLGVMLEEAKQAQSLAACLQVIDRMQKQLALRVQVRDRAAVDGSQRSERSRIPSDCPHNPGGDCSLRSGAPVVLPGRGERRRCERYPLTCNPWALGPRRARPCHRTWGGRTHRRGC